MELTNTLENIMERANNAIPVNPEDYEKDGRWYCGNCHTPKQSIVTFMGVTRKPMCLCKCASEKLKQEEEQRQKAQLNLRIDRFRKMGFAESEMVNWNFENDDLSNEKVTNVMKNYVKNFNEMRRHSKGLLLFGSVGTGKTYHACCVANALIDMGIPCMVTNFVRLANIIQGKTKDKQDFIDSLNEFQLLVIDDLGAERQSEFMQEMVFNIVDSRYRSGLPFIVTTNLDISEIKAPDKIMNARIYDRVIERCFPVEVTGKSRRKIAVAENYDEMKGLLGL